MHYFNKTTILIIGSILFCESIAFAMEKIDISALLAQLKEKHEKGQEQSFIASLPQELRNILAKQHEEGALISSALNRINYTGKSIYDLSDAQKIKLLKPLYERSSDRNSVLDEYINPLLQLKTFHSIANDPKSINELFDNDLLTISQVNAPAAVTILSQDIKEDDEKHKNLLVSDMLWFDEKGFGNKELYLVAIRNRLNAGVDPNFEKPFQLKYGDKKPYTYKMEYLTPLLLAIKVRLPIDIIKLLIEKNANVNAKTRTRQSPLPYAREYGSTEIVKLLEKHGAHE